MLSDDVRVSEGGSDYVRWPTSILLDYFNEGVAHLRSMRPDCFTETTTITIGEGAYHRVPEGYDTILELLANITVDAQGNETVGSLIREQDGNLVGVGGGQCAPPRTQGKASSNAASVVIEAYSKSGQDPAGFTVSPPVPKGATARVVVRAVRDPCVVGLEDLGACLSFPRKLESALADWVMHRAYASEKESAYGIGASRAAYDRFYASLEAARINEARHGSGYVSGAIGEGDEQARAR